MEARTIATLSTVNVKITGDTQQLVTSLTHAEGRVTTFASKVSGLNQVTTAQARGFSNLARGFTNAAGQTGVLNSEISILASSVGNVGLAAAAAGIGVGVLAGGLAASIASAISFETAITRVAKTANFSKEETQAFGDEILEMSRRLPVATSSLTNIAVVAGQLGIQGTANISRFVEEVAKLESTTGVGSETLATGLGTLIQVAGLPIDAIDNISASITNLGNTSNSTEQQILDFAVRLVGIGTALGVPLADILSISSSFAAAGVPVERGGTAIQNILIAIDSAAQKGGDELQLFADVVGQTAAQFKKLVETDPGIAFAKFVEGLKDVDNVIPVLEALEIADARIVASALSAANAQAGIIAPLEANRIAAAQATATNIEFARSSETTAAKLQVLKNNIGATAIELGTVFLPAVNLAIDGLNSMFEGAPERIENFKENMSALGDVISELGTSVSELDFGDLLDDARVRTLTRAFDGLGDAIEDIPVRDLIDKLDKLPGTGKIDALTDAFGRLEGAIGGVVRTVALFAIPVFGPAIAGADLLTRQFGGGGSSDFTTTTNESVGDLLGFDRRRAKLVEEEFQRRVSIPPGLQPKGASGPEPLTIVKALSDHVITLFEAIELGLSDAQVAALELGDAREQETAKAFRAGIELRKLAELFPGLTGEQIKFAIALGQIQEHLRETGKTIEQFILETSTTALEGFRSAFEAIFNRPTRETAGIQLQLDILQRNRLLRQQAGASDESLKPLDAQIDALELQLALRREEIEIIRDKNTLADATLLTDAAMATQSQLLTEALRTTSQQVSDTGVVVFLQMTNLGNAANEAAAGLRALGSIPGRASGGPASGLTLVGERGPELVNFPSGSHVFSNRDSARMVGESGGTSINVHTYITADSQASDAAMRKLAAMVEQRVNFAIRRQGLGGSEVSTNAFTPGGGR